MVKRRGEVGAGREAGLLLEGLPQQCHTPGPENNGSLISHSSGGQKPKAKPPSGASPGVCPSLFQPPAVPSDLCLSWQAPSPFLPWSSPPSPCEDASPRGSEPAVMTSSTPDHICLQNPTSRSVPVGPDRGWRLERTFLGDTISTLTDLRLRAVGSANAFDCALPLEALRNPAVMLHVVHSRAPGMRLTTEPFFLRHPSPAPGRRNTAPAVQA